MKDKIIAVPTQEISEIVQKRLFELGYYWETDDRNVRAYPNNYYGINSYIRICNDGELYYANRKCYFETHRGEHEEITIYDLYQMKPVNNSVVLTTEDGQK